MNLKLAKQVSALQKIYKDCPCHIKELVHKNLRLFEEVENLNNARGNVNFEHNREEDAGRDNYNCNNTSVNKMISKSEST